MHLIINDKGEILNFMFTPGNVDDREPLKQGTFLENIKGKLCADRILLRKRVLIETVNDELKNIAQIEHSRHRSFSNFIANSLSAIAAYCFFEKKPAIDVKLFNDGQLSIF